MKRVYYELVNGIIDGPSFIKIIIDIIVQHHCLSNSIISEYSSLFISKFHSSLCFFIKIKKWLLTMFYHKTNSQIERQNSNMEANLYIFVIYKQKNYIKLLPIVKFAYNNTNNSSNSYTSFELNCGFHR